MAGGGGVASSCVARLCPMVKTVGNKQQVVWHWVAVERTTKRVVGWAIGDRSPATGHKLWESLPADYRKRAIFVHG